MIKLITIMTSLMAVAASCQKDEDCIDKSRINREAMCVEIYAPVCGCDGETYSNECFAENSGVLDWEDGKCATAD